MDRQELHQIGLRPTHQALALKPSETARHRLEQDRNGAAAVSDFHGLACSHASQDRACIAPKLSNANSLHVRHSSTSCESRLCHGATCVELPGTDNLIWAGDQDAIVAEI